MLDMPFTTPSHLDKMIAGECSKSTKSNDYLFSNIQVHFLDAVSPFTGVLESFSIGTGLAIEDVESAVKAFLTFLGNTSCQCTSVWRQGIHQDYCMNRVSYAAESDKLFYLAMKAHLH